MALSGASRQIPGRPLFPIPIPGGMLFTTTWIVSSIPTTDHENNPLPCSADFGLCDHRLCHIRASDHGD